MKNINKISAFICVNLWLILICFSINAQTPAPGAPGKDAQWATAGKQAVGTSANLESKVWFTLAQGVMTEVYYPDVTVANVHLLQFVVVNPQTKKVETEQDDAIHQVKDYFSDYYEYQLNNKDKKKPLFPSSPLQYKNPDDMASLRFYQINTAKSGEWKITKDYVTDPVLSTVLINVQFETKNKDLELYIYYDPSLGNSGMHDTAWNEGQSLLSKDGEISSALITKGGLSEISSGFYQVSDGLEQLRKSGKITSPYSKAENGNIAQIAKVGSKGKNQGIFTVALGFGKTTDEALKTAQLSLKKGFVNPFNEYVKGWSDYVKTLRKVELKYQAQFNMAAMQLKALEDKTVRGANIASLTVPWGGGANANENNIGGYHLIWSRDLYQVFTAYMALGDKAAAERALDFLLKVQQKPDGSFPQNSYLDGKPFWNSLQMDEVAYPLIMAWELKRFDEKTWKNHVKKAADFIVKNGPATPQERWEEEAGYSPSTIAAEIAGLVCAAEIAKANNDTESANLYLKTADEWQANIEKWTVTTNGKLSKSPYYVRITQNGKPDAGEKIELNNGAGFFDEREIVDAGFLELVRLGIKSPDDPVIQNSVKVIDEVIRVKTPNGDAFYRYNNDGYGEMDDGRRWNWDGKYTGKGRLWALLSGERGQYELAQSIYKNSETTKKLLTVSRANPVIINEERQSANSFNLLAKSRLDAMLAFANEGLMIPEQIWDKPTAPNADKQFVPELKFGEGTGSATPLAWSMAQFIRLAVNLQEGKNLDTPQVVYDRYVLGKKSEVSSQKSEGSDEDIMEVPASFRVGLKDTKKFFGENADECEVAKSFVLKGSGIMSEPRKDEPSPQIFAGKRENKTAMLFTYFGVEKTVEIAGDFTGWKPCGLKFQDFPNSKILVLEFPNSARVEYKLIVDGKWINDPLNPNKIDNGVGGENSFFTMPDYKPTEWDKGDDSQKYFLAQYELESSILKGVRHISVYEPLVCSNSPCPALYIQDGSDYIQKTKAIQIQRNLVSAGKIKPFVMVFLDPKDRNKEYWANDDYAKFVATEVVPIIDKSRGTIKSRDGRAIMGASLGGITSFHIGLKYPEIFGRVGGQSSSFWVDKERVVKELEQLNGKTNFKFYIDDGTLEGVEDSRKVVKILQDKGFDVTYTEAEAGHNWTAWRDRLGDAFIAIWK